MTWFPFDSIPAPDFDYKRIHVDELENLDYKDNAWLEEKSYREIINFLMRKERETYIIDLSQVEADSVYLLKAKAFYPAEE